jgi:hypothetical protein
MNGTVCSQGCLPDGITLYGQEQIDSFSVNYPNCTEILGDVLIYGLGTYNLSGLNVLNSIEGSLEIRLTSLVSLAGLENLTNLGGGLYLKDNDTLTSLQGLENLTNDGIFLLIEKNDLLTNLQGLEGLSALDGLYMRYGNQSLSSLSGLNNVNIISGNVIIRSNPALSSLEGLENLTLIEGDLSIGGNIALSSLTGLENVAYVEGNLEISGNNALSNLIGLNSLISIGGDLWLGEEGLLSLDGIEELDSIGGSLSIGFEWFWGGIGNPLLTDITTLEDLDYIGENLIIKYNEQLSHCAIQSICDYLDTPNGYVHIEENALGCQNQQEVEEACETVGLHEYDQYIQVNIFPNPASDRIKIEAFDQLRFEEVHIFNQLGQKLISDTGIDNEIDISSLPQGLYIFEARTENGVARGKFIKR